MSPRSRSRSISPRRSYSKSPMRRSGRREHIYDYRGRSNSKQPPSPPAMQSGRNGRSPDASTSSSTSLSPRHRRRVSKSRSRSRSPCDKRHGTRKPVQNRCIGVFGLSVYTTQQKIRDIFSRFGPIERIQVVIDAQTGRSRGFCFIYYENLADAKAAKDACSGMEIDDRRIRVDYSVTHRPHTPTPGVYKGQPTRSSYRDREYSERYRDDYRSRRRSATPHNRTNYRSDRRRRYERSRSRSYTPRHSRY